MSLLVTGGSGFLGAWIIRQLLAAGEEVRLFDRSADRRLVEWIVGPDAARVEWICGDIADADAVMAAATGTRRILHLAGVLTPACQADPLLGARVNLLGTLHVFEAARRLGHKAVIYTSSAGVFGPDDAEHPLPQTHYGTFKLACEGSARAYWHDHRIASIGFRPYVAYGPGREVGGTAGPSLAARAAAQGEAYTIPYSGRSGLVYVEDVAAAYVAAATRDLSGAHVVTMPGETVDSEEIIAAIRRLVPDAAIGVAGAPLPIAPDLPASDISTLLPGVPQTGLAEGLARTIAFYRENR